MLSPPRCLRELLARPTTDPGVELDSVVEEWQNYFFSLACPCGSNSLKVRSFISRVEYLVEDRAYGPITLRCPTCGRDHQSFDPALHGYDVEIDHFPLPGPYGDAFRDYHCPNCAADTFSLIARFQYPDNVLEPSPGARPHASASEDLFSYFTLLGTCGSCKTTVTISSVECA